ncbi:MAG: branched-chain amino acid transport system ATP-binding protein [Actinomycetota bacterium]|nr:branched-chain amino acid transport system ATP-binding protein [Actinomycetota bacterium]
MLEVRNLHAGYQNLEVLHRVDLKVPSGRTVALLGANGAGKTTLLNVIAGLVPAAAGDILVDGRSVVSEPAHLRARGGICLVPEGRGIFRHLTVRKNIAMFLSGRNLGAALERVGRWFPRLTERLEQVAGTMSGGEQQMLAVCRALLVDAPIVMADELSVGLAPVVVDEIFDAVEMLRAEGRSLLIVEQYADRVLRVADYVYILHKGAIEFVGEPAQLADGSLFHRYLGGSADVPQSETAGGRR